MTRCQQLYQFYRENPLASNTDAMRGLKWPSEWVRKHKNLLKKNGLIDFDPQEGAIILKEYPDIEPAVMSDFKQNAYKEMYEILKERAENTDTSTPQLIQVIQEMRLILNQII